MLLWLKKKITNRGKMKKKCLQQWKRKHIDFMFLRKQGCHFASLWGKRKYHVTNFENFFVIWSVAFYLNFWWPLFTFIRVQQYNMKVCYCSRYNPTLGVVLLIFKSTASKREGAVSSYWWHCYPKLSTMTPRRASCDSCWHHVQGSERFVGGCCDP